MTANKELSGVAPACGLVYRNIRQNKKELSRNYEQWEVANLSPEMISGRKEIFEANLKLIEPFRRNNRVLDVGAGHGFFLRAYADRGWDCYGVEPSRRAVDYARRNFGLSLYCGAMKTLLQTGSAGGRLSCPKSDFLLIRRQIGSYLVWIKREMRS